jgi:hypothetical protein
MRKRIITVAFAAAILFSGAMLFQVENVDAQDATPADAYPELGKWIKIFGGDQNPRIERCRPHTADECDVGDSRKPQVAVPAAPGVPGGN